MIRALLLVAAAVFIGCGNAPREHVVVYTSQDQFYAEPILKEFTRETGIDVRPVFDTESAKTAGLANRLRHEAARPQCDVFWSNEEMHSRVLAADGVFSADGIRAVGYRTRRLVVNTNLLRVAEAPADLLSLTNEFWKGKIALAYPLYGTTGSHFVALRELWGTELWLRWCQGLVANQAKVVDGNSVVVKLVGAGEAWIGLTDSDDVVAGQRAGLPVDQAPLSGEMLVIPNTICLVQREPSEAARRFADYLASPAALRLLTEEGALEGIELPPGGLRLGPQASRDMGDAMKALRNIFLRS